MSNHLFDAQESTRQAKVVAVTKITSALLAFFVQVTIARALHVEDYARFSLFLAASSILIVLTLCGLDRVAFRVLPGLLLEHRWREGLTFVGVSTIIRLAMAAFAVFVGFGGALTAFPPALVEQMTVVLQPLAWFFLASSLTDSASIYCNGLARHSVQGQAILLIGIFRSLAILAALASATHSDLEILLLIYIASEWALAGVLFAIVIYVLRRQSFSATEKPFAFNVNPAAIISDAASTQVSYILRLPFTGPFLRLLVGSFAPPIVTAAYGFFQAIADRIYQFMPTIMLKGVLEPALVADYAKHADPRRLSTILFLLVKLSLCGVLLILSGVIAFGEPVVDLLTNGKYGAQYWLAIPICLHLMAQLFGESLWSGFNAVGRMRVLNISWIVSVCIAGGLMLVAMEWRSVMALISLSALPYLLMPIWLRWGASELLLAEMGGFRFAIRAFIAFGIAAGSGRLLSAVFGSSTTALIFGCLLVLATFLMTLSRLPLLTNNECKAMNMVSPKFAKWLRTFSITA